jgi:hypothetical protein
VTGGLAVSAASEYSWIFQHLLICEISARCATELTISGRFAAGKQETREEAAFQRQSVPRARGSGLVSVWLRFLNREYRQALVFATTSCVERTRLLREPEGMAANYRPAELSARPGIAVRQLMTTRRRILATGRLRHLRELARAICFGVADRSAMSWQNPPSRPRPKTWAKASGPGSAAPILAFGFVLSFLGCGLLVYYCRAMGGRAIPTEEDNPCPQSPCA